MWRTCSDIARRLWDGKHVGWDDMRIMVMISLKECARDGYIPAIRYQRNVR